MSAALVDSAQISFLLDLVILALSALAFSLVFARLKLTIVAGQILAGVVVGPYVLGWVKDPLVLNEVSEIGVVLLFFIIGLELDPAELRKLASKITSLTLLEIAVSFAFGLLASYFLGFDSLEALIFSMAASITSTAIVGRIFLAKRVLNRSESGFLIGLLVVEDMIAVGFLIVLSALTSSNVGSFPYFEVGSTSSTIGIFAGLETVASGLALILLGYGVARYVSSPGNQLSQLLRGRVRGNSVSLRARPGVSLRGDRRSSGVFSGYWRFHHRSFHSGQAFTVSGE